MSGKYDFGDGSNDYDNDANMKLEPPCKIRATLDGVFVSESDYSQSIGINLKNVKLVDGILGVQLKGEDEDGDYTSLPPQDGGEPVDGKVKVLSWEDEQSQKVLTDDSVEEIAEEPYLQRNYVGNNYFFEHQDSRLEGTDDTDYDTAPEEEIELGDFVLFFGATDNGPKSKSKTLAKILTEQGRDAVVDEDSTFNWLCDDPALRSDLMGKEVVLAMTQKKSDETGRTFHHPYVLDGKTMAPIFVDNSDDEEEEPEEEEEEEADERDIPDDVQSFFDTCSDLKISNEEAVTGLLDDMMDDGDIDPEQVEEFGGEEAIVEEISG